LRDPASFAFTAGALAGALPVLGALAITVSILAGTGHGDEPVPAPVSGPEVSPGEPTSPQEEAEARPTPEIGQGGPALRAAAEDLLAEAEATRAAGRAVLREAGAAAVPALEALLEEASAGRERLLIMLAEVDPEKARALVNPSDAWYVPKVQVAVEFMRRKDYLTAIHRLEAILVLEPDCHLRGHIRSLVVRSKELLVRETMINATIIPKTTLVSGADPVSFTLELENVAKEPIRLGRGERDAWLQCVLQLEIYEADRGGHIRRAESVRHLERAVPVELVAGEKTTCELTLKAPGAVPPGVIKRLRVSGSVRPETLLRDQEEIGRFIPVFDTDVFVLHPSRHGIAKDPIAETRKALSVLRETQDSTVHDEAANVLLLAFMLVGTEQRDEATDLLIAALQSPQDRALDPARTALAAYYARPMLDREGWLRWARKR
jgi:hypothetical protein